MQPGFLFEGLTAALSPERTFIGPSGAAMQLMTAMSPIYQMLHAAPMSALARLLEPKVCNRISCIDVFSSCLCALPCGIALFGNDALQLFQKPCVQRVIGVADVTDGV